MKQIKSTSFAPSVLITMMIVLSSIQTKSFAYQFASFQSQATQGVQWLETARVQKEEFTITIYPDYLDVQLDWEIAATGWNQSGWNQPSAFKDALEITGSVWLAPNSTVVGMLLWNGNKILKAKLKTKDAARKAYEDVVDRNVITPPRPRDPVLMEWKNGDSYSISIFPVEWGGYRKMRLRYLVPSSAGSLILPAPFSALTKYTLVKGTGLKGFDLANAKAEVISSVSRESVILDPTLYKVYSSSFDYIVHSADDSEIVNKIIPILEDSSVGSSFYIGNFFGNGFAGQALNVNYRIPKDLLDYVGEYPESKSKIYATLSGEKDSCRKEIDPISSAVGREGLKILARRAVGETLKWSVYIDDVFKKEVIEKPRIIRMEDGMQYARSFGSSKVYPWAEQMPFSLGSALGFIDNTYSLLALEEDVLPAITADKYLLTGVPTLNAEDIFPVKEDTAISANAWSAARRYRPEDLLKPIALNRLTGLPRGMRYSLRDGKLFIRVDRALLEQEESLGISIYSIKGKRIKMWSAQEVSRGEFSWSPSESGLSSGAYVIKVVTGIRQYSQTVFLR